MLLGLTLTAGVLGGCATNSRVTALESRIIKLERDRNALTLRYKRDQKRMKRLRSEIEKSSDFLRGNGARMTAKLDDLEDAIRRQKGGAEVLSHKLSKISRVSATDHTRLDGVDRRVSTLIADLRDRAGITILALPRNLPEHADDWVALAEDRFGWGEVRVAEAIAKECSKRFAGTKQAGRCGLIQARIAYEEHRFGDAVVIYQAVHDGLDGKPVPEVGQALNGIAAAFEAEGKCKRARDILGYIVTVMKRAKAGRAAKERLKTQKQRCSNGKVKLPPRTSGQLKRAAEEKKAEEAAAQAKAEADARAQAEAKRKAEDEAVQKARATSDAEKAAAEEAAAEEAAAEKAAAEKAAAEKTAAEKTAAEKAAAEKATSPKSTDGATDASRAKAKHNAVKPETQPRGTTAKPAPAEKTKATKSAAKKPPAKGSLPKTPAVKEGDKKPTKKPAS